LLILVKRISYLVRAFVETEQLISDDLYCLKAREKLDPDLHLSQNPKALEAQNRADDVL
jgi:hypothetical protein